MSISLSTFLTQLMNMVPEADTELNLPSRNQHIKQAMADYSRDRPDIITTDFSGDGGKYYGITASLTSWSDEFSRISAIQYPAPTIAGDETPVYLEPDDWDEDYYQGGTRYLWLPNHAPAASETVRVEYTAPYLWTSGSITTSITKTAHGHTLNDFVQEDDVLTFINAGSTANLLATHQVTTVTDVDNFTVTELAVTAPEFDFFAIANRAACLVCQALAERFSRSTESTVNADRVRITTRAKEFSERAKEFCNLYNMHMGIMTDGASGVGGVKLGEGHAEFIDLDPMPTTGHGRDFLHRSGGSR